MELIFKTSSRGFGNKTFAQAIFLSDAFGIFYINFSTKQKSLFS